MLKVIITAFYVLAAAAGLVFLKLGTGDSSPIKFIAGRINLDLSPYALIGIAMYGLSFIMYIYLLSKNDLGFIIPLTTGLVYILILTASYFIFHETFTVTKIIGVTLIFIGIVLLTWNKVVN